MTAEITLKRATAAELARNIYQGATITNYVARALDRLSEGLASGDIEEVSSRDLEAFAIMLAKVSRDHGIAWEEATDELREQGIDPDRYSV